MFGSEERRGGGLPDLLLTFLSYEQEARMFPNFGCAHATCHTAPSCLHTKQEVDSKQEVEASKNTSLAKGLPFQCGKVILCVVDNLKDLDGSV